MTTADTKLNTDSDSVAVKTRSEDYFVFPDPQDVFPDPPDRTPEEMTTYRHLNYFGIPYLLRQHFGAPDTTIVDSEHYITPTPPKIIDGLRFPDLLIAFDADPSALARDNAYVISDQGKPPDFVLEIASRSTGHIDTGQKRDDYASLGIPEYWRFDETGEYHGARIAGDRLVDGRYEPIEIVEVEDGILEGYSTVLHLNLRWEHGELKWHDPETGEHIPTFESERARADQERESRLREQSRADDANARADALEAELRRLRRV